jgi:hypothetical protein
MTSPPELLSLPNGWHLVTVGAAQISVAPDGLLMFPRHCTPEETPDYVGAMTKAAEIGTKICADNTAAAAANTDKGLPTQHAIVTEGPPPAGATALPRSSIGRPKRPNR